MSYIKELMRNIPQTGRVEWVSIRPQAKGQVLSQPAVTAVEGKGLLGDHYSGKSGNRQVTLLQAEHLPVVASILQAESIDPTLTRRNIVVSGINLLAFTDQQFQIGEAVLEMTGHCHPCSRMEENLGEGGYNAMRGHGGITARIVQGGLIKVGDPVKLL